MEYCIGKNRLSERDYLQLQLDQEFHGLPLYANLTAVPRHRQRKEGNTCKPRRQDSEKDQRK